MRSIIFKASLVLFGLMNYSYSEVDVDTFTYINGFTSATMFASLHVFHSKVYKNSADINWWEDWPQDNLVDQYLIRWGKDPDVFPDTINLKPYTDSVINTTTLENLEQGTKYYVEIIRDYNARSFVRDFVFTTPPLDPILPIPVEDYGYIDASAIKNMNTVRLYQQKRLDATTVEILTITGQKVAVYPYSSVINSGMVFKNLTIAPGIYIACFKNAAQGSISSEKFIVGK